MFELNKKNMNRIWWVLCSLILGPMFLLLAIDWILIPLLDNVLASMLLKLHLPLLFLALGLTTIVGAKFGFDLLKRAIKDLKQKMYTEFVIFIIPGLVIICIVLLAWYTMFDNAELMKEAIFGEPSIRRVYIWR
ncbi:hypothetical protein N9R16_01125 [Flavobacteriaceae bacterium]|nr:hypothetical protein [Flavobacteriaceae bacterium]